MQFATKTIHACQPCEPATGAVTTPIFQTSTFRQESPGVHQGFDYSRTSNPTRQRLEAVLAELEGVEHCAVFASGLCAENAILQAWLRPGDRILIPPDVYGGTHRLLHQVFAPMGVRIDSADFSDSAAVEQALSKGVRLIWIETPTNPRLLVYDIGKLAQLAKSHGTLTVVDNTFATPLLQRPFELGADLVIHSATKYLSGHSDLIQGAVLAQDPEILDPVRFLQNATGGTPSSFDCWLTLRGLKTLELRVERHADNAQAIVQALEGHPQVEKVYFPGLPSHPGHEIACRQMRRFAGMLSLELAGDANDAVRFVSSRRYFTLAESLGGVRALICHPATMTHSSIPAAARAQLGLSDTLVRLSPGCENASDLIEDILQGLEDLASRPEREEGRLAVLP